MAAAAPPRPLEESDDRASFDCGRESVNAWLRRHGWANHRDNISRVSVSVEPGTPRIAGFVTLSASQIERGWLAKARQRGLPEQVPAALLGQLGVDVAFQGQGYAVSLLQYALRLAVSASKEIGCAAVITHPLDDRLRAFYARWGFQELPFDPRRAMIIRIVDMPDRFK